MIHLRRILARFYGLFVSSSRETEELEREINAHLLLMEDDFRSKGMSPQEARQAARRAFGGVEQVKQLHREERTFPMLFQIAQDIRLTLRRLRRTPVFTVTAILMLAFGIGATSAIFSMVDAILLRPLPFADPSRLVLLGDHLQGTNWGDGSPALVTPPEIQTYIRDTESFESLGAFAYAPSSCELSIGGTSVMVPASRVTAGVFSTLGVAPTLGRTFTPQEDEQGEQVVVLSYATWESRFQGSPNVLGAKLLLDRNPYVVIGVMPQTFQFPIAPGDLNRTELWVPMSLTRRELEHVDSWRYPMVGRLKPGITLQRAQNDAERVAQQIMQSYPADMAGTHIDAVVKPLQGTIVESARPLLRILFLAVTVVLLIACANLAGLLLVRALRRQREIAIRLALGTTVFGLLRHILLEGIVLSLSGGLLGIAFAALSLNLGKSLLSASLPRIDEIGLNWHVVSFALLLSVATAVLCGLAPAFAAFHTNTNTSLKEGGRGASSGGTHARLRSTLVVVEIAVATVLLTTSGLLMRSFEKMNQVDLGFLPEHVVTGGYWLPQTQYAAQSAVDTFNSELIRNLRRLPGVQSVGLTDMLPASGDGGLENIVADGYVIPQGEGLSSATPSQVMGDYFSAMGIPLLQGRFFDTGDRADTQLVVIVNHKLAQRYWPKQNSLGKRLRIGSPNTTSPWMTVIGEVADVKLGSPDADSAEQFYQPVEQAKVADPSDTGLIANGGHIVLRASLPPERMENSLRTAVYAIDPLLPLTGVQTMDQILSESEASRRFNTVVVACFASTAVLLAVLGIYSVIAFSVGTREQEMAIRITLGAQRAGIMRLVVTSGAQLALIGCGFGFVGSFASSRLLRSLLFDVSPLDPVVFISSSVVMLLLALAASSLPAWHAAEIDPIQALRGE